VQEVDLPRTIRILFVVLLTFAVTVATIWVVLALWYRLPAPELLKDVMGGLFVLIGLASILAVFRGLLLWPLAIFVVAFGAVLGWWSTIIPQASADWASEVAQQVTGKRDGDILTLTNVRGFEWRSNADFTGHWSTRTYDLSKLQTLDLFLSYWGSPYMAHVMMSFGFEGGDYLTWSVEVRRRKGGEYSPVADLFKSDPLVIIASEERDVVGVRSNIRGEDVQLYRLRAPTDVARELLLEYVADANRLATVPEFYNSLTTNCATTVVKMMRAVGDRVPLDWQLIVDGYLPGYIYQQGALDNRLPLVQLQALSHIDKRAREAGLSSDYSRLIRVGVPSPHDP
jgi:Domain of unknown function (DUF4105)